MSSIALMLIAHGSRRAASNREVAALAQRMAALAGDRYCTVVHGFIELAEPSVLGAATTAVAAGATELVVLPYFLAAGRHVVEDIPEQLEAVQAQFPDLALHSVPYLGAAAGVAPLLLELAATEVDRKAPVIAYQLHGNCYLNITNRCTLRCRFCPKHNQTWDVQSYDLRLPKEPSVAEMIAAIGDPTRYQQVVFCGLGEPTQRLDALLEVAAWVKQQGVSVRVNTDGLANLIHDRDVTPQLAKVVNALSISLNSQDPAHYEHHTRPKREGAFAAMLAFAEAARDAGIEVTLTAIDGLEGTDIPACEAIADRLQVKFRRRELDVVG